MNSESFTYWLKGFVELQESDSISDKQWLIIKDHLNLVFDKVTPNRSDNLAKIFGPDGVGGYSIKTPPNLFANAVSC